MKVRALLNIDDQQMYKKNTGVIQFFLVFSKHDLGDCDMTVTISHTLSYMHTVDQRSF